MIRLRQEVTDRFVTIPIGFDLVSMFVEFAASIAVGEGVGVKVLEGLLAHCISFFVIARRVETL